MNPALLHTSVIKRDKSFVILPQRNLRSKISMLLDRCCSLTFLCPVEGICFIYFMFWWAKKYTQKSVSALLVSRNYREMHRDGLCFLPVLLEPFRLKKTSSKFNVGLERHSVNECHRRPMSLWASKLEFFSFSRTEGSIALLHASLGGPRLSRSRLFRSRSVGRESIRDPLLKTRRSDASMTSFSYFHGRDSACHGPMIPFFIPRRVSTARERNTLSVLGSYRVITNRASQSIRWVWNTSLRVKNAEASQRTVRHVLRAWCGKSNVFNT